MTARATARLISVFALLVAVGSAAAQRPRSAHEQRAIRAITEDAESRGVPGVAYALVRRGQPPRVGALGLADIATRARMTPRTRVYAGSLSKPFTALVASALVDDGRMALSDPVRRYVPELALADGASSRITIAHLLTHTAGLPREGGDYWFTGSFPDAEALTTRLDGTELRTPPGEALHYSNVGYALLGLALGRAANTSYDRLLARVLSRLAMPGSAAGRPTNRLANGYSPPGRVLPSASRPFAGLGRAIEGGRRERMYHDADAMSPAFGVHTTARDLGTLVALLLGETVRGQRLSDGARARMTTVQHRTSESGAGWTYGLRVAERGGRIELRHNGWFAAHRTHLVVSLDAGVGVAIVTNSDDGDPRRLAEAALDAMLNRPPADP